MPQSTVLHGVHERFADADPALPNGFAEHAPMGVEAMVALGLDASVVSAWAAHHEPQPLAVDDPVVAPRDRLRRELRTDDWRTVLRRHASVLLPASDAHLFHGLIRTAHAVRALDRQDDDAARSELATGLAAWSVWADRPLATDRDPGGDDRPDADPPAPPDDHGHDDPEAVVLDAARRGAGAFLVRPSIFTLHAVTAPMALHLLWPVLGAEHQRAGASAFLRSHAAHPPVPADAVGALGDGGALTGDEIARVAEQWDAHPAKLVEACRRGHAHTGDPVFLAAARQVLGR